MYLSIGAAPLAEQLMPKFPSAGGNGLIGGMLASQYRKRGWTVFSTSRRIGLDSARSVLLDLAAPHVSKTLLPEVDVAVFAATVHTFTGRCPAYEGPSPRL